MLFIALYGLLQLIFVLTTVSNKNSINLLIISDKIRSKKFAKNIKYLYNSDIDCQCIERTYMIRLTFDIIKTSKI